jgi:hypothetical protein
MLMGVTSWELGVLRVPLIMVPDKYGLQLFSEEVWEQWLSTTSTSGTEAIDSGEQTIYYQIIGRMAMC